MGIFGRNKDAMMVARDPEGTIHVDLEVAEHFERLCTQRQMDASAMLGFMTRSFDRKPQRYGLEDILGFGKYRGELCEDVVRADPAYMRWVADNAESVVLEAEVLHLLVRMPNNGRR